MSFPGSKQLLLTCAISEQRGRHTSDGFEAHVPSSICSFVKGDEEDLAPSFQCPFQAFW